MLVAVLCGTAWSGVSIAQGPPGGAPPSAGAQDSPVIDKIQFTGNTEVSSAELAKVMKLKAGDTISREKMHADLDSIVALYRKKGHNLSVSPDISHPADGHVAINIKIDESGTAGDAGAAPSGGGGGPPGGPPPGGGAPGGPPPQ